MTADSTTRKRGPPPGTTLTPSDESTKTDQLQQPLQRQQRANSTARDQGAMRFLEANGSKDDYELLKIEEQRGREEDGEPYEEDQEALTRKAANIVGQIAADTFPHWLAIGVMLGLIFGGCCSNVSCKRVCCRPALRPPSCLRFNTNPRAHSLLT